MVRPRVGAPEPVVITRPGCGRPWQDAIMSTPDPPFEVAVVGAGPSGIFAAQSLLSGNETVKVDLFDRLPTPFGLLRYGVAPDHTSIKAMMKALARVFTDERVSFRGLVELGRDITSEELLAGYDAVIYAAGASEDARLGIPGENLPGSRSAREFVAWYSGHPDAEPQSLEGIHSAVTFGVGNVAIDVARFLLAEQGRMEATDVPQPVLDELTAHPIDEVWVVGRRGPQHASFTTKELEQLLTLPGVRVILDPEDLEGIDTDGLDRRTKWNLEALQAALDREVPDARATLRLAFWRRPRALLGTERLEAVELERTVPDAEGRVHPTGEVITVPAQLALRAIGYRAIPLPGVPFDREKGVIPNDRGRVLDETGQPRPREYAVGWIKRGPVGVIGTNKRDAAETVELLLEDLRQFPRTEKTVDVHALLEDKGVTASTFADWERIDSAEQARGATRGRQRTKVETWSELLDLAHHGRAGGPLIEPDPR